MSEPLTDADLDAIERRANAASPGPWKSQLGRSAVWAQKDGVRVADCRGSFRINEDVAFIAAARMDVPALIVEARRLHSLNIFLIAACQQLACFWEQFHSCPCGARKESPRTHPHVIGCPTAIAIDYLKQMAENS